MKRFNGLILMLVLLLVVAFTFSSCTCGGSAEKDDDNDDTNNDTDDTNDDTNDDIDDDLEDWYTYTIDTDKYSEYTSIAVDSNNKIHISYCNYYGENKGLMYASNEDGLWRIFKIDGAGKKYPSIDIDSANKVHVSYFDGHEMAIKYATNKAGLWQISTVADVGTDGPSITGYNSLALDSNDKVHIAYHYCGQNGPSGCQANDLKYVTNSSSSKSDSWRVFTIDSEGEAGIYPSISVDQNTKVHIAYFCYYCPGNCLKYATNQSGNWQTFEVECSPPLRGTGTSIALDSAGKVHISYQSSDKLKYATNASGTWQIFTVDDGGDNVGAFNSIAVDSNDKIHISYFKCLDASETNVCFDDAYRLGYATNKTGVWQTFEIDSDGRTGSYTSIAVDSDGYVHISYQGEGGVLKYATNRPPE